MMMRNTTMARVRTMILTAEMAMAGDLGWMVIVILRITLYCSKCRATLLRRASK